MIVDWHSHWIPPELAPRIGALRPSPVAPEFTDIAARLRFMDEAQVARQVISWPTTFGLDALLAPEEAAALYREYNDRLAAELAAHPDRFWGLAAVPAADPAAAAAELERTRAFRGMIGAVVPVDAFLTPAGAESYRPLLELAHRTRSHLYVHPGPTGRTEAGAGPIGFLRVDQSSERWLMETGARLGAAALTLERSTLLDDFPGLSIHVSMLGGHLAWIAETLAFRSGSPEQPGLPCWPLRRIQVDTGILKPGGRAIAHAVAMFGSDRILFGSDFPQFGTRNPTEAFAACGLEPSVQQSILHLNSDRLARDLGLLP